jgi:hypothetical protein
MEGYVQYSDSTSGSLQSVDAPNLNDWHFCAYSFKKNDFQRMTIDGVSQTPKATANTALGSTTTFRIGTYRNHDGRFWNGDIAGVYVVSSALTDTQKSNVQNNYPDVTLEAGKICVRKYAATTQPSHDAWGNVEHLVATTDALSAEDEILRNKLLFVVDYVEAAEALLGDKRLLLCESIGLEEQVFSPTRFVSAQENVSLSDAALVDKVLVVSEGVCLVEMRRKRLHLVLSSGEIVLGDLIVPLSK